MSCNPKSIINAILQVAEDQHYFVSDQTFPSTPGQNQPSESKASAPRKTPLTIEEQVTIRANKDAIINDFHIVATTAYQFRLRPASLGGGQGSYIGFALPFRMKNNQNAAYDAQVLSSNLIKLIAVSAKNKANMIVVNIDGSGNLSGWTYTGDFKELP